MTELLPGWTIVLGSRSPRRRELLGHLVPASRVIVKPPLSSDEAGFEGLSTKCAIVARLHEIVATKARDVCHQIARATPNGDWLLVSADTAIVCQAPGEPNGNGREDRLFVIGQPPTTGDWQTTVRRWFLDHYAGKTHNVITGLQLVDGRGHSVCETVETKVTFHADLAPWIEWYLATGESAGKAGGYALQGAGSVFINRIDGSLTNVIGLPLEVLTQHFLAWPK